ncbi:MAG: helix-turn-helix transcriptional regulator [Rhodobacteraceae bacterium]|nr:helix-turn-helix transcriptional regulator [Paracoccaceae bacterium]
MWETASRGFAAMGSEARLQVLKTLIRAGEPGLSVSEIQQRTGMAPSTLAHHLKFLAAGGLVDQQRVGRSTVNTASFGALKDLAQFILAECCVDISKKAANNG